MGHNNPFFTVVHTSVRASGETETVYEEPDHMHVFPQQKPKEEIIELTNCPAYGQV